MDGHLEESHPCWTTFRTTGMYKRERITNIEKQRILKTLHFLTKVVSPDCRTDSVEDAVWNKTLLQTIL